MSVQPGAGYDAHGEPTVPRPLFLVSMLLLASCGGGGDDPGPIVFVGDSITALWNYPNEFPPGQTLTELVPNSIAIGYAGQTSVEIATHFSAAVLSLNPSAVVIEAGTNDLIQLPPDGITPTTDAISTMAEEAAAQGARVLIANIPATSIPQDNVTAAAITAFNQQLRTLCSASGYTYLNYQAVLQLPDGAQNPADFGPDGIHPNPAGFKAMLAVLEAAGI